jgi:hypothetical protein
MSGWQVGLQALAATADGTGVVGPGERRAPEAGGPVHVIELDRGQSIARAERGPGRTWAARARRGREGAVGPTPALAGGERSWPSPDRPKRRRRAAALGW